MAGTLRTNPGLAGSSISIESIAGQVTLSGTVANPALKGQAVALARQVPGVATVVDELRVGGDSGVRAAQYEAAGQPTQVALGFHGGHGGGMVYDGAAMAAPISARSAV